MATYTLEQIDKIEAEDILKGEIDIRSLFNIDFLSDHDNILLLKKICLMLYDKLLKLEREVKMK